MLSKLRSLRIQKDEHQIDCYNKIKEAQDIIENLMQESKMNINLVKTMVHKKMYIFTLVDNAERTFDEAITL